MSCADDLRRIAERATAAAHELASVSTAVKNAALELMAAALLDQSTTILAANARDRSAAEGSRLSAAMIERLTLTPARIQGMADGLRTVAALNDPVGEVIRMWRRPNKLQIGLMRVPIGVICIIYESRPNVTSDAAGLALKSGNAVILRGGSEAFHSNRAIAEVLAAAAEEAGMPSGGIHIVPTQEREAIFELLKLDGLIDLVVPRGGEALIRAVVENTCIPVIRHEKGLCHTYVDGEADLELAVAIAFNAKVQRPSVCNAMETLLVHRDAAERFLPLIGERLKEAGVEIRGCPATCRILPYAVPAEPADWETEYLDLVLSVKVVASLTEAIDHVNTYGSKLADAIVTTNYFAAQRFLQEVDSAAVFVNASTRFTDGGEFGMGAELGISTQKLHVRGPMGLESLTTTKYIVLGEGQIRE